MLKKSKALLNTSLIWFAALILLWTQSVSAAENILQKIEHISQNKSSSTLRFINNNPPDFEIFENLNRRVFIIKFRNTSLANIPLQQVYESAVIDGIQIQQIDSREYWVKVKVKYPGLNYRIQGRKNKNSGAISIQFYQTIEALVEEEGIKITNILREINPRSEKLIMFSEKPLQFDITQERKKTGKMMKVRLLNARLAKDVIVPGADTDILKSIEAEKRGKYLIFTLAPQNFALRIQSKKQSDPIRISFTVSEKRDERIADEILETEEVLEKKEQDDQEKLKKDRFLTRLFDEAEKQYKTGRFRESALSFKNIYNFAPSDEIGVRANFRSADALFQLQRKEQKHSGEILVIREYKNAINSAMTSGVAQENIPRAYFNVGRSFVNLKFYEDAYNQFEIIQLEYPESPYSKDSLFYQGVIHLNMERYEKSVEVLQRFVEENANSPRIHIAYYKIGEAEFQLKRYQDAKKSFDKAWSINANYMRQDPELMFHMGEAYFENTDFQTARAIYEQLVDLYPSEVFSNLVAIRIGDFLRAETKLDDAVKAYQKAINEYPKELSLIGKMRIANILAEKPEKDEYKKALDIYEFIVQKHRLSDQIEEASLRRALTLGLFHHYADAISSMEEFCGHFPDNIYVKNNIIQARILETINAYISDYYYQGKYLDSLGVFEQYEQKYFSRPQYSSCFFRNKEEQLKDVVQKLIKKAPLFLIADSYFRLGLREKALQINNIILKDSKDPLASIVLFNQGKIYDSLEQPEEAQKAFLKFVNQYPEHTFTPQVKKALGDSYLKVQKPDRIVKAIRYYKQTIRDYQESDNMLEREIIPACWFALGNLYQSIGRYDDSINAYKKVISTYEHPLQSENVDEIVVNTHFIMGNLYLELNQLPEAMETYQDAIRLYPQSDKTPWATYHLGEIYLKNDQKDKALEKFQELVKASEKVPDALWGPMAGERAQRILNDLKYDKYLTRSYGTEGNE